jgi:hypothetical protein
MSLYALTSGPAVHAVKTFPETDKNYEPAHARKAPQGERREWTRWNISVIPLVLDLIAGTSLHIATDYRVRLVCPHWDYDRWVVKKGLALSLHEVMNTFWHFKCPNHGSLHLKPLEGQQKKIFYRAWLN